MPAVMTIPELERFWPPSFRKRLYPESGLSIEAVWDGGCLRPPSLPRGFVAARRHDLGSHHDGSGRRRPVCRGARRDQPVPLAVTIDLNINFCASPDAAI